MPTMQIQVRQLVPLALLYEADDHRIEGRTRFQKLAFLLQERLAEEGVDLYEFIEYDYGPFAKELYEDLEMYQRKGLVEMEKTPTFSGNSRYDYELTNDGVSSFEDLVDSKDTAQTVQETAREVTAEYGGWSIRRLLDFIYKEHPRFQEKSVYY